MQCRGSLETKLKSKSGQIILSVILLVVLFGLIALIGWGIKSGKIVINPSDSSKTVQPVSQDILSKQEALLEKEKQLKELERQIRIREEQFAEERKRLLQELNSVKEQLIQLKKQKEEDISTHKGKDWKYLAKLYGAMRPEEAAKILKEMDTTSVAMIISNMGNRQAAKLLSALPTDKSIAVTYKMKEGSKDE